ncbi:MAG TPA: hypothetical protein GX522_08035 [Firmicutes bacterium]|nr:hypothetical protein [Bacillota bacterium]
MYFSAHLSSGILIGALTKNAPIALGLGFLSHGLLDSIPHHDYSTAKAAIFDLSLGLLVLRFFRTSFLHISEALFWGALGATIPDLEIVFVHALPFYSLPSLYPSHRGLIKHPQRKFPKGVIVQLLTMLISLTLGYLIA